MPEDFASDDFVRGDVDGDGEVSLSDPIVIPNWLGLGAAPLSCLDAADVDDDGCVTLSDVTFLIGPCPFVAIGPCTPAPPFPTPGPDPTLDYLGCER